MSCSNECCKQPRCLMPLGMFCFAPTVLAYTSDGLMRSFSRLEACEHVHVDLITFPGWIRRGRVHNGCCFWHAAAIVRYLQLFSDSCFNASYRLTHKLNRKLSEQMKLRKDSEETEKKANPLVKIEEIVARSL